MCWERGQGRATPESTGDVQTTRQTDVSPAGRLNFKEFPRPASSLDRYTIGHFWWVILGSGTDWAGSNSPKEKTAVAETIATYCLPSTS